MVINAASASRLITRCVQASVVGIAVLTAFSTRVAAQPSTLVVSVASSMHDALVEIAGLYRAATGVSVAINTGSSSTLARQIVEGAPVCLFLSADDIQMNVVEKAGRIVSGTRKRLLTNELAVVVPPDSRANPSVRDVLEGRIGRLAMGEPSSVPAGVYGRQWLTAEKAWDRVAAKVIPFPTVRAVLSAVESGRVDAGIVYRTDAITSSVKVIARVSPKDYPGLDIAQPAAVISGPMEPDGRRFLEFLESAPARAVFTKRGFGTP